MRVVAEAQKAGGGLSGRISGDEGAADLSGDDGEAIGPERDISLERIAVSQTNFEDSPVTLTAQMTTTGLAGKKCRRRVARQQNQKKGR